MKPMNKFGVAALVLSTAVITACSDSSSSSDNGGNDGSAQAAVDCEIGQVSPNQIDGKEVCVLSGVINRDLTLSTNFIYELDGAVAVGTGNREIASEDEVLDVKENGVTLTIDPGVEFRSSEADTLIITRGSKIMAEGTAAEPITMSSADAGFDGNGEWGGLILMGFAENNLCFAEEEAQDPVCNLEAEGGAKNHGGDDNADNSGSIKYLRIAEGGFEVSTDNEVNGLTLFSVGYNTVLENIQIHGNQDDGIEFFGGTANVKHLVLTENMDDSIDWDEGFRGNIQYALVRRVEGAGQAIEADNAGPSNDALPISKPSLANFTFVNEATTVDYLARLRRGTGAFMTNGAFVDADDTCLRLDDPETANQAGGELEDTNVLMDCTNLLGNGNGNTKTAGDFNFTDVALSIDAAYALNEAEASVATTTPTSANATSGFFDATNYVGAVEPGTTAANAWWADWTIPGSVPAP